MGKKVPGNVTHYKAIIPELCDTFWAVLVTILEEYYEDEESFKIFIFGEDETPATLYRLLTNLRLNTEVKHLISGETSNRLTEREKITPTLTHIPYTQAIEVGLPVSQALKTPKRMQMLQQACESTGKTGRFITITHPYEMERSGSLVLAQSLRKKLNKAEDYHIDFTENASLFRQRFNQLIISAFVNVLYSIRKQQYLGMVKHKRRDFAEMSERSQRIIKDLHRCGIMMDLSKEHILEVNTRVLVTKMGAAWLIDGNTASEYEQPGIEEAMRVLHITAASKTSMPVVKLEIKAEVVDLTANASNGGVIDLTMED